MIRKSSLPQYAKIIRSFVGCTVLSIKNLAAVWTLFYSQVYLHTAASAHGLSVHKSVDENKNDWKQNEHSSFH